MGTGLPCPCWWLFLGKKLPPNADDEDGGDDEEGEGGPEPDAKVATVRSLFSAANPFHRNESAPEEPPPPPPVLPRQPLHPPSPRWCTSPRSGPRLRQRWRPRGRLEGSGERGWARGRQRDARGSGAGLTTGTSGGCWGEEDEAFDDEGKLLRAVFVGNLPPRTKKKVLTKEFTIFGMVNSVRIRSVPLGDTKIPRKGAVIEGKINDSVNNASSPPPAMATELAYALAMKSGKLGFEGTYEVQHRIRITLSSMSVKNLEKVQSGEGRLGEAAQGQGPRQDAHQGSQHHHQEVPLWGR
ncbi:hypothetical protein ZWY2020_020975 [Hordeum vulgare]|nr:hypothetical protein ZWY2020_020975 [Hordeum vulgare]